MYGIPAQSVGCGINVLLRQVRICKIFQQALSANIYQSGPLLINVIASPDVEVYPFVKRSFGQQSDCVEAKAS